MSEAGPQSSPSNSVGGWEMVWTKSLKTFGHGFALWFPLVVIMGLIIYVYYVYVVAFCTNYLIYGTPSHKTRAALYIVAFHIFLTVFLVCYWGTVIMSPGLPSEVPNLKIRPAEDNEDPKPIRKDNEVFLASSTCKFCLKCQYPKPPRTHHCSVCQRCTLKMDHHCVWLNNCVGYKNYGMFLLTLFYGSLCALFVMITLAEQLIYNLATDSLFLNEVQYLIATVFAWIMFISALGLLLFHLNLTYHNMTTIEHLDRTDEKNRRRRLSRTPQGQHVVEYEPPIPRKSPYDIGRWENYESVLGPNPWLWLVPFLNKPRGDGIYFETNATSLGEIV